MQGAGRELCDRLRPTIPGIIEDTAPSRQFKHAHSIVEKAARSTMRAKVFVIALGTNGPISRATFDALLDIDDRTRFAFVNIKVPREWEQQVNDTLREGVDHHSTRAAIMDWHSIATANPNFLRSDSFHLNCEGADAYALALLAQLSLFAESAQP